MLVLSRKTKESVVVGGSSRFERVIKVTVLQISGRNVRLGFEVEADVPVHRLEVWERIVAGGLAGGPTQIRPPPDEKPQPAYQANACGSQDAGLNGKTAHRHEQQ
jgi:carbon storage regulator